MISRKANKLVPAREQLQALTAAELTEVSGGREPHGGSGGRDRRHHRRHHHRHHHHKM